jgi:hypothetical protein
VRHIHHYVYIHQSHQKMTSVASMQRDVGFVEAIAYI